MEIDKNWQFIGTNLYFENELLEYNILKYKQWDGIIARYWERPNPIGPWVGAEQKCTGVMEFDQAEGESLVIFIFSIILCFTEILYFYKGRCLKFNFS